MRGDVVCRMLTISMKQQYIPVNQCFHVFQCYSDLIKQDMFEQWLTYVCRKMHVVAFTADLEKYIRIRWYFWAATKRQLIHALTTFWGLCYQMHGKKVFDLEPANRFVISRIAVCQSIHIHERLLIQFQNAMNHNSASDQLFYYKIC